MGWNVRQWIICYCIVYIEVRLPLDLDEILDIKLGLTCKEKQANLSEINSPFLLYDSVAIIKVITIFLATSAKFTPLNHWIIELVVELLEISQMFLVFWRFLKNASEEAERGEIKGNWSSELFTYIQFEQLFFLERKGFF